MVERISVPATCVEDDAHSWDVVRRSPTSTAPLVLSRRRRLRPERIGLTSLLCGCTSRHDRLTIGGVFTYRLDTPGELVQFVCDAEHLVADGLAGRVCSSAA